MKERVVLVLLVALWAGGVLFAQTNREPGPRTYAPTSGLPVSPAEEKPLLLPDHAKIPTVAQPPAEAGDNAKSPANGKLLLLEDDQSPLLLSEETGIHSQAEPVADNSRCQVCHLSMCLEELSVTHAKRNIGCAKCHGECDAHIADESWASGGNGTAPETMYPKPAINSLCRGCHTIDKMIGNRPGKPCPKLSDAFAQQKFCTDCHGKHRLVERRCKWK